MDSRESPFSLAPQNDLKHLQSGFSVLGQAKSTSVLREFGEHWIEGKTWTPRPHRHDFEQFYYMVSGEVTLVVGDQRMRLLPGMCVRVAKGLDRYGTDATNEQHLFFAVVNTDELTLEPWVRETIAELEPVKGIKQPPMEHWFRLLCREVLSGLPMQEAMIARLLELIVTDFARSSFASSESATQLAPPFLQRGRYLLETNYNYQWSVRELAAACNVSTSQIAHTFTRNTGMSPLRYLREVRMRKAAEWLSDTDRTITEIALEVGFASSQHFASTFHKYIGMTPSQYRRSNRSARNTK